MSFDPLKIINDSDPLLIENINKTRDLAFSEGEISKKNKFLIAMAIDAAKNAENGIRYLAIQAIENGATKNEIMETLRIVNYICGVGSIYTASAALKDVLK